MKMNHTHGQMGCRRCVAILLFLAMRTLLGQDISEFGVLEGVSYQQITNGVPTLLRQQPYSFNFFADGANQAILGGRVVLPLGSSGITTTIPVTSTDGNGLELRSSYSTAQALDSDYPPGNYSITLTTVNDGELSFSFNLPLSLFPAPLQLLDFQPAQSINSKADFTLVLISNPGGTPDEYVQAMINSLDGNRMLFETPQPGQPGALDGTTTSVLIPANTLGEGQSYQLQLLVARLDDLETTYGFGFSAYFSQTDIPIATSGSVPAPTLTIDRLTPDQWHLHANGVIGQNYLIESTTSLSPPVVWQPMVNFIGSKSGFDFTDGVIHRQNFYRARPVN